MSSSKAVAWRHRYGTLAALLAAIRNLARSSRTPGDRPLRVRFVYSQPGAATRYRVLHTMEQAELAGFQADHLCVDHVAQLYDLHDCDLLYLYRLALNSQTWPLLAVARLRGIPVIFDSDDLVWDERERAYNYLDHHYPPAEVANILLTARRTRALMRRVDAFVFSTPFLARIAGETFAQPAFVNRNALGEAQVAAAEAAFAARQLKPDQLIIGYFCGTPRVHDEDLASVAPALAAVLAMCPAARLRLYGEVALPPVLANAFAGQIERRSAVSWETLPEHIAQVDINIAPLVDNPQRRAKSAVKYLEAALLRVPTVASRLDPYTDVMIDNETGLLASTVAEWAAALLRLARDPALRQRLGEAAYLQALTEHTTAARAPAFGAILKELSEHHFPTSALRLPLARVRRSG